MMCSQPGEQVLHRERALAMGVAEIAAELRLVNIQELVRAIQAERHANLDDLVSSAAELFYKPDTVRLAHCGTVELEWDQPPAVILSLQFCHNRVSAYFRLVMRAFEAAVSIDYLSVEPPCSDPEDETRRLFEAIEDARLHLPLTAIAASSLEAAGARSAAERRTGRRHV